MPLLDASSYGGWALAPGPHWETIAPNLTRRRLRVDYHRERLELTDGDFLDVDLAEPTGAGNGVCLLLIHGLEGDARAPYLKSFARASLRRGYRVAALNLRGCSGELNRAARFYHSGETGDLRATIGCLRRDGERIGVVGFSLGGNLALKYLGEDPARVDTAVSAVVAISAPVDLAGSAARLAEGQNWLYMRRFIALLSRKIEAKAQVYPELIDPVGARSLRSFAEFDGRYTAPLNGFASAEDYWRRCSALQWLGGIENPALMLSARNDPFLSPSCFPEEVARSSALLTGCFPERGGHIGFPGWRRRGECWHEAVALDYLAGLQL